MFTEKKYGFVNSDRMKEKRIFKPDNENDNSHRECAAASHYAKKNRGLEHTLAARESEKCALNIN